MVSTRRSDGQHDVLLKCGLKNPAKHNTCGGGGCPFQLRLTRLRATFYSAARTISAGGGGGIRRLSASFLDLQIYAICN